MKKILLLILLSKFSNIVCDAQNTWQKWIITDGNIQTWDVKQTSDGGYIICGSTYDDSLYNFDAYLVKLDAIGTLQWTKIFATSWDDNFSSILLKADGGFVICGWSGTVTNGVQHMFLMRTDATGDSLWSTTFGGNSWDSGFSLFLDSDGGYVICGATSGFGGGYDGCIVKTDSSGNVLWVKTYNDGDDAVFAGDQTSDGGYVLAGATAPSAMDDANIYLLKTDSMGDLQWTKIFGDVATDKAYSVKQTSDSGYIITGVYYDSFSNFYSDMLLIKTNSTGNIQWSRTYGGGNSDEGDDVIQTADGGYLIAGATWNFGNSGMKSFLVKTDSNGNVEWCKANGLPHLNAFSTLESTSDGGYIAVGNTKAIGGSGTPMLITKTDSAGISGCFDNVAVPIMSSAFMFDTLPSTVTTAVTMNHYSSAFSVKSGGIDSTICLVLETPEMTSLNHKLEISPNPAFSRLKINSMYNIEKVEIFNLLGDRVIVDQQQADPDVSSLPPGFYFVIVTTENGTDSAKFIKE